MRDEDVITREPLNAETSWAGLLERLTPVGEFYTRNNFAIPTILREDWRLELRGTGADRTLRFEDLAALPTIEQDVVLECAGNSRTFFDPPPGGTPWRERAVACARFRGARLADVLDAARVPASAVEILFTGGDGGSFQRSLPRAVALAADTMLAYEMNGAPLEPRHGAPVRVVVPSWYAVASVKWLAEIRALDRPFVGHFQTERYVYAQNDPVREKRVNSIIVAPTPDARLVAGVPSVARGWAWSRSPIARVEVTTDAGKAWRDADLGAPSPATSWRAWSFAFTPQAGDVTILARATDATGAQQPERAAWNEQGYGYNAPRPRRVVAVAQATV